MGYGFNDGYHRICDNFEVCVESPQKKATATPVRHGRLPRWGWGWLNAKKVRVCRGFVVDDIDQDGLMLGCCRRITRRPHFFCKLKAELSRRMSKRRPSSNVIFKYDASSYALNFDNGSYRYDPHALPVCCKIAEK